MRSATHRSATGLSKACVFGTDDRAFVQSLSSGLDIQSATLDDRDRRLAPDELTRHSDTRGSCADDADLGIEDGLWREVAGFYLHETVTGTPPQSAVAGPL
jgi:hypothetical protein